MNPPCFSVLVGLAAILVVVSAAVPGSPLMVTQATAQELTNEHAHPLIPWTSRWVSELGAYFRSAIRNGRHWGLNDTCSHPVSPFPCAPFDAEDGVSDEDRTADQVRHKDIRVVGVLGDSISAGFAMISSKLPNTRVLEYRGKVFSIGGDDKELTIPNFMKSVSDSSSLVGAPKAISLPLAQGKGMDRAVSGAIAQDLPGQATSLVNLLLLPRYLIHRSQWKLVTVLIGANNVCGDCLPDDRANTTAVVNSVREALLTLRNSAPRWKINLLGVPSVTQVYDAALPVPYCAKVFERFHFCPCIHEEKWRKEMDTLVAQYNREFAGLAQEFSHDPHFRVTYQPGFTGTHVSQYGQEYLSKLDCFHPNLCANQVMAAVLWNNMLEGANEKTTEVDPYNVHWKCPSRDNMYIH